MTTRPIHRTSAIFPVFRKDELNTNIEFLNYWSLKDIKTVGAICTLRDQEGELVDRSVFELTETRGYSIDCGAILEVAGVHGPFVGSIEFEGYSSNDLHVPTPALIAVYHGDDHQGLVHAYTRTYNDYEEAQRLHSLIKGDNYGWPLFDNEKQESYFVLVNGPKEVEEQQITVDIYNSGGKQTRTTYDVETLPPYACRVYTAAGDNDIVSFLDGKPGWMRVNYRVEAVIPLIMGGCRQRQGTKMSTAHAYGEYAGRSFFLPPGTVKEGESPYHLPVSLVSPNIPPKIFIYPILQECTLTLDAHLYGPGGNEIHAEPACMVLEGGMNRMSTIDCSDWVERFPKVELIDFVARPHQTDRIPSRLHCSILYGNGGLDMCMAEVFKFYTYSESSGSKLRWGLVEQSPDHRTHLCIRNVGFATDVKTEANLDLQLWREGDSKSLRSKVSIPANGSVVSSVDQLFPGAEEFLDGGFGWYTAQNAPSSIKTISIIEDITSGTTSGEHGF